MNGQDLYERYVPLALAVARNASRDSRCPAFRDEVRAAALVGLWKASLRVDPACLGFFPRYARKWVLGEIREWLRQIDPLSRKERGLSRRGLFPRIKQLSQVSQEPRVPSVADMLIEADSLDRALACLPERDREVFRRRLAGERMRAIGRAVGLSPSRVSQILKRQLPRVAAHVRAVALV